MSGENVDTAGNDEQDYDREKYVSYAEYLRDVNALKNKNVKIAFSMASGIVIGFFNILLIEIALVNYSNHRSWNVGGFAMDLILAYLAVIFVLLIPGIWIGVSTHKYYSMAYFGGFSIAGVALMLVPVSTNYFLAGLYVFVVSFFLLVIVYLVFFKIWISLKRNVARAKFE